MAEEIRQKTIVPNVGRMTLQILRSHILLRHSKIGFASRTNHNVDHLLNADTLDHRHRSEDEESYG